MSQQDRSSIGCVNTDASRPRATQVFEDNSVSSTFLIFWPGVSVFEEEAQHLPRRIRPSWIGVGAG